MNIKYQMQNLSKDLFDDILNIMNNSKNNNILTNIKNKYIVNSFYKKKLYVIFLNKNEKKIGFIVFNLYSDKLCNYIIINIEYLCVIKKYQSKGLSKKLIKYLLKKKNHITKKFDGNNYESIYLSAILVNTNSFSNVIKTNKIFPVNKNPTLFNNNIIENVKKLNDKFLYVNDYLCFNIFTIKPLVFINYLKKVINNRLTEKLKIYNNLINFPIGLGFYISIISKIK